MHLFTNSLLFRAGGGLLTWSTNAARHSLTARSLRGATRTLGRVFASSLVFGTSRLSSLPLAADGLPLSVRVISRPYVRVRAALADGAIDPFRRRLGIWSAHSTFSKGAWIRLVGAALIGTGCGGVILAGLGRATTALVPVVLILAGLLALVWGPRLALSFRDSLVFRRFFASPGGGPLSVEQTVLAHHGRLVMGTGIAVCAALGLLASLVGKSGPVWLVVLVLAISAAVLLLKRPEAVLLAVAAFPWLDWLARRKLGGLGAGWDEGLLLLSLLLVVWGALVTGRLRLRTVPITLPAMVALAAAVGSIVVNGVPQDVGVFALRVVCEPVLFFFAGFLLFTTARWLRWIVAVFQVSTVGLAAHGLYQYAARIQTPTRWVDATETDIITRAFSVIGNPNGLGAVLVIGCLVALALLLSPSVSKASRFVLGIALVIQLGGVAVTFSRGSWIGLVCGIVALLVLAYRKYLVPAGLVALVGVFAAPGVFVNRFLLIFSGTYLGKSAVDGRTYRWTAALDQIAAHPWFGMGLGTFGGSAAERFQYWSIWVDNYYLQMGAEGGLLLLASFAWLLTRVGKGLVKGFRVAGDPFARALAAGVFGAFVATIVINVFVSVFETLSVGAAFWLLSGVATSAAFASGADRGHAEVSPADSR